MLSLVRDASCMQVRSPDNPSEPHVARAKPIKTMKRWFKKVEIACERQCCHLPDRDSMGYPEVLLKSRTTVRAFVTRACNVLNLNRALGDVFSAL